MFFVFGEGADRTVAGTVIDHPSLTSCGVRWDDDPEGYLICQSSQLEEAYDIYDYLSEDDA